MGAALQVGTDSVSTSARHTGKNFLRLLPDAPLAPGQPLLRSPGTALVPTAGWWHLNLHLDVG